MSFELGNTDKELLLAESIENSFVIKSSILNEADWAITTDDSFLIILSIFNDADLGDINEKFFVIELFISNEADFTLCIEKSFTIVLSILINELDKEVSIFIALPI